MGGRQSQMLGPGPLASKAGLVVAGFAEHAVSRLAVRADMAGIDAFADHLAVEQIRVDAGADFDDDSGPLVARNDWIPDEPGGSSADKQVDVGPANPRIGDVDYDLTGSGLRLLELDQLDGAGAVDAYCSHSADPRRMESRRCQSVAWRSKWAPVAGCSATKARSSSTPRPGAVGRANQPSTTGGSPIAACWTC